MEWWATGFLAAPELPAFFADGVAYSPYSVVSNKVDASFVELCLGDAMDPGTVGSGIFLRLNTVEGTLVAIVRLAEVDIDCVITGCSSGSLTFRFCYVCVC